MKKQDYCIGLDIGTNSTGFAMTDMKGNLLKHKNRSTFGAVLFEEAQEAKERRMKRSARRRLDRREQRIDLLQMLMSEEISKVDFAFFARLNESFLHEDDRKYPHLYGTLPKAIWTDGTIEPIPTIYHLRSALAHTEKKADIRYVYLALHHIIKYRGNFLSEGETLESINDVREPLTEILSQLAEQDDSWPCQETVDKVYDVLKESGLTRLERKEKLKSILQSGSMDTKAINALASLWVGGEGSLEDLCGYSGDSPTKKLSFMEDFDEEAYIDALGNDAELFKTILQVYRWHQFCSLREDGETISQTMIHRYNLHRQQLKQLKMWFHTYCPEKYSSMFRGYNKRKKNTEILSHNYVAYCRQDIKCGNAPSPASCTQKQFYTALEHILEDEKLGDEALNAAKPMLAALKEENGFLPLQRIYLNGVIPNQLHVEELGMILDQQGKYYPSLLENRDKIISICSFRLPYFVGPLNTASPHQKWLSRVSAPARPWNIFEVVDKIKTADGFIKNLTNKCTYLPKEDVLPLHSLLYEEYLLWDELNAIRINDKLIGQELKDKIVEQLFKNQKKVSITALKKWLSHDSVYCNANNIVITGYRDTNGFASSLSTYCDFRKNGFQIDASTIPMIEELIQWSTIFENRTILREKIEKSDFILTPDQINFICRKRYTGWGRFSRKLLDGILGTNQADGKTVIEMMRSTNNNFMQVLRKQEYGFAKRIDEENDFSINGPITLEEVQALQGSPALKRGIWQAVQIVEELIKNRGYLPRAIYIENTREDDLSKKGKRIPDRIQTLEGYYKGHDKEISPSCRQYLDECKEKKLRLNDRQFLYFLQLGKCMYSEKPLDFNRLEQYEIDHILPQSLIKDDSIENRVLVLSGENGRKGASALLSEDIRISRKSFWEMLRQMNLIGPQKMKNLTRRSIDEKEILGFVKRQLVETSQIIKHVINLFKGHYRDHGVEIYAVKAQLTSGLRHAYELYKVRELNDSHHAFDAFLACTLGLFTSRFFSWIHDDTVAAAKAKETWKKNVQMDTNGIVLGAFNQNQYDDETGEELHNKDQRITYLKKVWGYRDHFFVYRKYENTGAFFNETRYPAGSVKAKFPLRKNLPVDKYGGFDSINPAYIVAFTYKKGKKRIGALEGVPVYLSQRVAQHPEDLVSFLEGKKDKNYVGVRIIRTKILLNQRILCEGSELLLKSAREAWNGRQLYLPTHQHKLLHQMMKSPDGNWEISEDQMNCLIDTLLKKLKTHYPIYSGVMERINTELNKIKTLSMKEKGIFVFETLKIMNVSGQYAMYKKLPDHIKLNNSQGRITNKNFDISKIILIDQSSTGFYERRTPLWDSEQL